jgi:integrase
MTRRRQGTGTIERRKQRDGSIRFMPRLPDADRTPLGTFPTYEEAAGILEGAVYRLTEGRLSTSKTLGAYGLTVLDRRELDGLRNVDDDRRRWKYVTGNPEKDRKPWRCAEWQIGSIKRSDVLDWTRELAKLGLSHSTRVNALALLRAVFASALDEDRLIESNPAADVTIKDPGQTEPTMRPLTLEQLSALFWSADDEGRVLLAATVGACLRNSELRMLRHVDVFLKDPRPHILVCRGKGNKAPKNGKVRRVPLFGLALEAFRAWTPPVNDRGLFFANFPSSSPKSKKRGIGTLRHPSKIVKRAKWLAWLESAGIDRRVRWHDLRHTGATLLLLGELDEHAWSLEELQDLLGHSTITMTEKYAKLLNLKAEKAARRSHTQATRFHETPENKALPERDTGFETLLQPLRIRELAEMSGLAEVLTHARSVAIAILMRAREHGDVERRVVELAGDLLDAVERTRADRQKTG